MTTIIAKTSEQTYPKVPIGVHKARCIKVIDLGTQKQDFKGDVSWKRQALVIWELPEQLSNDLPMTISKFYSLTLHEKSNLGQDLVSWRGRPFTETEKAGFNITKLIGQTCQVQVMHKDNGKEKISNIIPLPKDMKINEQYHPSVSFSIDDFQKGQKESFNQLSEGIRNMILRSKELDGLDQSDNGDEGNGNNIGEVPF
jgi:hypothetical protein|tara:strand:- start:265 stop:861 length:597 start_codon:yes stop_codon:yes gene_type:complete